MSPPTDDVLRQLRTLKIWSACTTVALVALVAMVLMRPPGDFDEIDVRRINLLNESGLPALVLAGQGRLPGPTAEGVEYPQELSGGRVSASGMIFFNARGDEVGGLTFAGDSTDGAYRAYGGITFDQFRQDQVVSIQYQDDGADRASGLHVWDRTTEVGIGELLPILERRRSGSPEERESAEEAIRELAEEGLGAHRVFLGSRNRTAALELEDAEGRVRMRLAVDSAGTPSLELFDADGTITWALPR